MANHCRCTLYVIMRHGTMDEQQAIAHGSMQRQHTGQPLRRSERAPAHSATRHESEEGICAQTTQRAHAALLRHTVEVRPRVPLAATSHQSKGSEPGTWVYMDLTWTRPPRGPSNGRRSNEATQGRRKPKGRAPRGNSRPRPSQTQGRRQEEGGGELHRIAREN